MPQGTPLEPGDPASVAGYRVTARLGSGGQGTVFLGQASDGALVAIKLLHTRLDGASRARVRFAREIGTARRVASFCTARVLAADVEGDVSYLVSEFIDGPTLSQAVRRRGPLTGDDLHRLAVGTATALVAIHAADVVHRDFKPSNILLGDQGPRVVDFGIARAMDAISTLTSQVIGTPAYMAPEQVAARPVGPAADIFAWGATLIFAATGRAPFGQDSVPAVFQRVLTQDPNLGDLPEPLRAIVASCLAKDPADRPTAEQLLHRLLHGTATPSAATPAADPREMAVATRPTDETTRPSPRVGTRRLRVPTSAGTTVNWKPRQSWATFVLYALAGVVLLTYAITTLLEGQGAQKGWAVPVGLGSLLSFVSAYGASTRPLNVRAAEIAVRDAGIIATLDGHRLEWAWGDIEQVAIQPLGNSRIWGRMGKFCGIHVVPAPGARLNRLTAWQRYPVWGLRTKPGWKLLIPLGRVDDPHVAKIEKALSRYGREGWTPHN
ncbi:serine/threonine-protein kinase [Actinomadura formosensis]|uniref:serine/threonine-protein kinase n=1 Tax=Actinomadura formosensis TaxID=60706 RepID=UPI003D8F9BD4